jgi:hypothetical protein
MSVIKHARFIPLLNYNTLLDIKFYNSVFPVSPFLVAARPFETIRPTDVS